jgi:LysR family transcriptional activator of nhaA
MDWLNYNHLLYVWTVARHGSIAKAGEILRLSPPTISAQIHELEDSLGQQLFVRQGRNLVPTEMGEIAARYGDQIFSLGQQLVDVAKGRSTAPRRFVVGVSDVLAKSIVHRILEPAFLPALNLHVICKESRTAATFHAELAGQTMDIVLSDSPASRSSSVRMYNHLLGECGTVWLAAPALARQHRRRFPRTLASAPLLLPSADSHFRRDLDEWFARHEIRPSTIAELDDVALVSVLGGKGLGVFAAPDVLERELRQRDRVEVVGRSREIRQRFFAISIARELEHPGVAAIFENARQDLFAPARSNK